MGYKSKKSISSISRKAVSYNLGRDFGLGVSKLNEDGYDINMMFDADPPRNVLMGILTSIAAFSNNENEQEKEEITNKFFEYVSAMILDIDIEEFSFDTPELAAKAMDDGDKISWGLFYSALAKYISILMLEQERLKKTLADIETIVNSGENNKKQEEK